jgi:type II secretory pathway pseudopilin PulG
MAALLVALAVMAVLMSVALPVWRHEAQREKEEELVFRGQQYMRALRLYQMKTQTAPGSIDLLVTGRFIRKKYKDPITGDDFELIGQGGVPGSVGQQAPAGGGRGTPATGRGGPQTTSGQAAGSGRGPAPITSPGGFGASSGGSGGGTVVGGIQGVRSKSKDESIRLYQGRNHYNEWMFINVATAPGGPGRGGPGGGPGGRGQPGPTGVGTPGRGGRGQPPFGGRGILPGGLGGPPGGRGRSNQ